MYRMHSTDNYLPETGRGALVIKRIPPGPPAMAKLAPKKEWALDKKLISTVVKFSKFSVKVLDYGARKFVDRWQTVIDNIPVPDSFLLLHPSLLRAFPFFHPQYPALQRPALAPAGPHPHGEEHEFLLWRRQMGLTGGAAFAGYDPVVSSEQSDAQRQARMQAFRATMREAQEPTTSRSARVFPGDFILASHDSGGVDLFKVEHLSSGACPSTVDLQAWCTHYSQTVLSEVGGLWGVFKVTKELQATGKNTIKMQFVPRSKMLVFNVQYQRNSTLSLESLKALSYLNSNYPMPDVLPDTHISPDEEDPAPGGQSCRRAQGSARARRPATGQPARAQPARKATSGYSLLDR
jgi:hypothetical protein